MTNSAHSSSTKTRYPFYVGTSDEGEGSLITYCELDIITGSVVLIEAFGGCQAPGYLCISPNNENLYAVNTDNTIAAFSIDHLNKLHFINSQPSGGANPCHVSVHPSGKLAFVSNYSGGSFSVFHLEENGSVGPAIFTEQYEGTGPNADRQEMAHPHYAAATPDGRHIYVVDLGTDKIMNYEVDAATKTIATHPNQPFYRSQPGSGPRHLVMDGSGNNLFLLNELASTLTTCSIDENNVITTLSTYPTLPAHFTGYNISSAIRLHPNGRLVYVSNRGYNSISGFVIKGEGKLEKICEVTQSICIPRDFNIDPTGKFMIVANEDADNLVIYTIDPDTGMLYFREESAEIKAPGCIIFRP
jgi:6-phosphogluconolactonase